MPAYSDLSKTISIGRKNISSGTLFYGLVIFVFGVSCQCTAQRSRIDSLKRALPILQDTVRIDCLNTLSLVYSYLDIDTAAAYQQRAFSEAHRIQYQRGEALSLNNKARIAGRNRDFPMQEKICTEVIESYALLKDQKVLTETYLNLALSLFCQGHYDRSINACEKVITLCEHSGDKKGLSEAIAMMGSISFERGNYEKSFEYFNQSLAIFTAIKDSHNTAIVLAKIGDLYRLAGDHKSALDFYHQSLEFKKGSSLVWHPLVDLGDAYYALDPGDSSLNNEDIYLHTIKSLTIRTNNISFSRIRNAEKYIASKHYDDALVILQEDLRVSRRKNDTNYVMRLLLDIARAHEGKKNISSAFDYTRELLRTATQSQARQYMRDGYKLMYLLHDQAHRVDSAYYYFQKYTAMKDAVALTDFGKRLAIHTTMAENEKAKVQLELLSQQKQIGEQQLSMSEQKLKGELFQKKILVAGICLVGFLGIILFRNNRLKQKNEGHKRDLVEKELKLQKLEMERANVELQQRSLELEMQALRSQMNPHFIFNSLNSINRFILQSNKNKASEYLTKFSRLIRLILQNSQQELISLESELESLQLYLELEAVRFEYHFDFNVNVSPSIDISAVKVPPLIIQPYAENAIWHGLMHKVEKGHLVITISEDENLLICKIADDGIGRKKASELKSKSASAHKSMGMRISADRIAILHQKMNIESNVIITDLTLPDGSSGGTEVRLKIPIKYD